MFNKCSILHYSPRYSILGILDSDYTHVKIMSKMGQAFFISHISRHFDVWVISRSFLTLKRSGNTSLRNKVKFKFQR